MPTEQHKEEDDEYAVVHALEMAFSYAFFSVLKATIKLGLFDIIAKETTTETTTSSSSSYISPSRIAELLLAKNSDASSMIDRMLYLLACHSLLHCRVQTLEAEGREKVVNERSYRLAQPATFFVDNSDGCSLANYPLVTIQQNVWDHMKDAILEGGVPFEIASGGLRVFEFYAAHESEGMLFDKAMSDHSNILMKKILETYKGFQDCQSLVDIGGGTGVCLHQIITKHPSIKGINFDLPMVIKHSSPYPGIEHVEGDMFSSIPKSDTILLKWITHNWDDERVLEILQNCYEALPSNGKVIIIEKVVPLEPDSSSSTKYISLIDNLMLVLFGAKERTQDEIETLCKAAGFSEVRFVLCVYTDSIIELYK